MGSLIIALALFAALTTGITALRDHDDREQELDVPRRLPDPGSRDLHAVSGTLGRAYVPSWG